MKTIRRQLIRGLLVAFAVLLGCGGIGVYLTVRTAMLEQFDETLRAKANAISSTTEVHGKRINAEFSEDFMREYREGVAVGFFQLRQSDGTSLRRSKSLADADLPTRFGTFRRPKYWDLNLPSRIHGRAIGYRFSAHVSREGEAAEPVELTVVVASDRSELDEDLTLLALALLGCGGLLLVATALIVPRVLRRGLAPLDQLAERAGGIDADSLSTRFPVDSVPGELKPISERLNSLLARLEESFERERRFSADLAHEMRTPIAELRSLADLALKWPESRNAEMDRDTLAIAIQMEGIVVRLLEALRSERGQLTATRENVMVAPMVKSICQTFSERISENQLQLTRRLPEELEIESDPVLLRSILTNLIDNAVEYTPRGGAIGIDGGAAGGSFTIRIMNSVEDVEPADLEKFFHRFWRKDPARSGPRHSGLGLSLARAFAQAVDCELTARLEGKTCLILALSGPAKPAATPSHLTAVKA